MNKVSSGLEPLCDVCNRNRYPCHCPLARDDILLACKHFVRVIPASTPSNTCNWTLPEERQMFDRRD